MSDKLNEMWQALEAHKPKRSYAKAWRVICVERTRDAARSAAWTEARALAAEAKWAADEAARALAAEAKWAAEAAARAAEADQYAQRAIDALRGVKP